MHPSSLGRRSGGGVFAVVVVVVLLLLVVVVVLVPNSSGGSSSSRSSRSSSKQQQAAAIVAEQQFALVFDFATVAAGVVVSVAATIKSLLLSWFVWIFVNVAFKHSLTFQVPTI